MTTLRKRIRYLLRGSRHTFKPIFLVAAPRSGTTWANKVLGKHPMIASGPELYAMEAIAAFLRSVDERGRNGRGVLFYTDRWEVERCCQDLFHGLVGEYAYPLPYFLASTPYNTDFMGEIERVFPEASVIHLIRDGRDVALSLVRARRERGYEYFPTDIEGGAKRWRRINSVLDFGRRHPDRYIEVRYERLVEDFEGEVRRVFNVLGIPLGAGALSEMRRVGERRFHPSAETGNRGLVGKWRHAFSEADVEAFERVAGDLLVELGYEADHTWAAR